jgi:hypothetical protein
MTKIELKNKALNDQAGFTMIEMLFYMVFVVFIMGSTFGIVSQLLRNSESLKTGISTEEEGNFVLKKISWVLNDASAVNSPAQNSTSASLSVNKNNTNPVDPTIINPIVVSLDSGKIMLGRGGNPLKQLSNDRFTVQNLSFVRTWDGVNSGTDSIKVSFQINGREFQLIRQIK